MQASPATSLKLLHYVQQHLTEMRRSPLIGQAAELLQRPAPPSRIPLNFKIGVAQSFYEPAHPVGCFEIVLPAVSRRGLSLYRDGDREPHPRRLERKKKFGMDIFCSLFLNRKSPQIL